MKHKIMLLVSVVLVGGIVQAMQDEQCPSLVVNQEAKVEDADRDADSVREWLLEGVEVIEMQEVMRSRIETLFRASWHRKILKGYAPDMVSDALTQLEYLGCFQALANSQPVRLPVAQPDSQAAGQDGQPDNGRVRGKSGSQILEGSSAARAKLERSCMIALLSKLGHEEKRVAEDKREQRWQASFRVERYICWVASLGIPSLFIGDLWPVIRCGP